MRTGRFRYIFRKLESIYPPNKKDIRHTKMFVLLYVCVDLVWKLNQVICRKKQNKRLLDFIFFVVFPSFEFRKNNTFVSKEGNQYIRLRWSIFDTQKCLYYVRVDLVWKINQLASHQNNCIIKRKERFLNNNDLIWFFLNQSFTRSFHELIQSRYMYFLAEHDNNFNHELFNEDDGRYQYRTIHT